LSLSAKFNPGLIFLVRLGAYLNSVVSEVGWFIVMLRWKWASMTNTLAYCGEAFVTAVKSLCNWSHESKLSRNF
jgi:hypothetical protein